MQGSCRSSTKVWNIKALISSLGKVWRFRRYTYIDFFFGGGGVYYEYEYFVVRVLLEEL